LLIELSSLLSFRQVGARCRATQRRAARQRTFHAAPLDRAARALGNEQFPHRPEAGLVSYPLLAFFCRARPAHRVGDFGNFALGFPLSCQWLGAPSLRSGAPNPCWPTALLALPEAPFPAGQTLAPGPGFPRAEISSLPSAHS